MSRTRGDFSWHDAANDEPIPMNNPSGPPAGPPARGRRRGARIAALGRAILWLVPVVAALWAAGALWFDLPMEALRKPAAILYLLAALALLVLGKRRAMKMGLLAGGFAAVLAWWLTIAPSNDRAWQPDVAETPWAEVKDDVVTLHNVRNFDYRTETDYTPHWETRTVKLSQITGLDLAITYWGSAWMAHPIVSFQFADAPPVCFSIETRKEIGESYSTLGGIYRRFELVYVCADERDVVRLRTNYRKVGDVYLYRTTATPAGAQQRFLEYIAAMNELHVTPRWYNAATSNCTTSVRTQRAAQLRLPWDWRILFNGYGDEMLYEHRALAGGLPFAELKARAWINDAARAAEGAPDFSRRIRADRPGFAIVPR